MLASFNSLVFGLVFFTFSLCVVHGQDHVITPQEQAALDKLKSVAGDVLKLKYFKEDFVLVHFLRAKELDVDKTVEALKETAVWRKTNQIDKIVSQDLLEDLFPYQLVGVDKKGRPIVPIAPARWDIRKVILAGNRDKLVLKWAKYVEESHRRILEERAKGKTDVTQAHLILDLHNYNLRQHACLQCFPTYFEWVRNFEFHYPHIYSHFTYINTPRIFTPLLELLKPVFSAHTRKVVKVLGPDKQEWKTELDKSSDPSERTELYGGTKKL